jgi:GAF domain-containing protein
MPEHNTMERYLAIFPGTSEESALRMLIQTGLKITRASEGSILVLDQDTKELVFAMTVGSPEAEAALRGQRVPLGAGITGLAALTGDVQIGSPTYQDVKQTHRVERDQHAPEAVLAAPIFHEGKVVGVMTAVDFTPGRRFETADGEILGMFSRIAGLIIELSRVVALSKCGPTGETGHPKALAGTIEQQDEVFDLIGKIIDSPRPDALPALLQVLRGIHSLIDVT